IPGTGITFTIPQSVITCLGTANKVSDLLVLANKKLGNQTVCTSATLADVVAAMDAVNRGFDRCRINTTATIRMMEETSAAQDALQMKAYPNPTEGETTIEFVSENESVATIELYDLTGAKVASVFNNTVAANSTNTVNFNTGNLSHGTYFVRLTVDGKSAFTRLVVIK
ncbi:MAG: T9SS type A sorting domain-containing protein, partial [Bacteroidota bacterium]